MPGMSSAGTTARDSAAKQGSLEAVALLEHRYQALAHSPFFGVQEAAKPSLGWEGLLRLHPSEPQPASLWSRGGHHGTSPFLLLLPPHRKAAMELGCGRQSWGPVQDHCLFARAHSEGSSRTSRQDTLGISHSDAGLFTTHLPIQILTDVCPSLPNPAPTATACPAFTAILSYKQFITRQ